MKTLVIIPTYNEAANIGGVIKKIKQYHPELDILVVDDGSCDETTRLAIECGAIVARHPYNLGYGTALQTGYKYAARGDYDFVIQLDGDGQHDPKFIKNMFDEIENGTVDVVIGSRFAPGVKYKGPLNRKIGTFLFSRLVSLIISYRISDATSGFQVLNRRVFKFLTGDIYPNDYPDADVLIMLHRAGFQIKEIPVFMNRGSKSMHKGLKPLYYICKMVLAIFVTLLRNEPRIEKEGD